MTAPSLAAAVIGPKAQGRNYGLRRYAGPRLSSEAQARLDDFAMSLTGWAILRRERMAAMFPLNADQSSFAVVRARNLGEGELGPIAVAHMLIVPRAVLENLDWASHRLLRLIPEPDDAAFGLEPPALRAEALGAARAKSPRANSKLAWSDVTVDAESADPEQVLGDLIDGVNPPEQRARLTGWATTSLLARAGALDPAQLLRLVVHAPAESLAAFEASHAAMSLKAALPTGPARGRSPAHPLAWTAWVRLGEIGRREPDAAALAAARWSQEKAGLAAEVLVFEEIARACATLPPAEMVALLRAVARAADGSDAVSAILRQGVSETFDAIVSVAHAEGVAFYIQRYLAGASLAEVRVLAGLDALLARPPVAAWLGEGLDVTLALCLPDVARPETRRLAASLLRLHCGRSAKAETVAPALAALLAQPASATDLVLADAEVVRATAAAAPHLSASLAARAVQPAMRAARSRQELHRAAWALLAAERVGASA
jgi:hypothetical protein